MRQPPTGLIVDDREIVTHRARTSRGPRLQALGAGIVVIGLVVVAALGPRPGATSGGRPEPSPQAVLASPDSTSPITVVPPAETLEPWPTFGPGVDPPTWEQLGLPMLQLPPDVPAIELPESTQPLDVVADGLYYVADGRLWLADLAGAAKPRSIASLLLPCSTVATASAAGPWVAYLEFTPALRHCDAATGDMAWRLQLVDTKRAKTRTLVEGTWASESPGEPWIPLISLDEDAYAITVPDARAGGVRRRPSNGSIVEVRRLSDDKQLWKTETAAPATRLLLRRTGLFMETFDDASGAQQVAYATPSSPVPTAFGSGTMAVSRDGGTVGWLQRDPGAGSGASLQIGWISAAGLEYSSIVPLPCGELGTCSLDVDRAAGGDRVVWQPALGDDSRIGICTQRWPLGAFIYPALRADWVGVVGGRLVWLDRSSRGVALHVLDLDDPALVEAPR